MNYENSKWLVVFDTDRIKNFVFATNTLKEIRGASALLVEQDKIRKEELKKQGELIYSAGGGGTLLVDSKQKAQEVVAQIERDFRFATITGSITAIAVPPDKRPNSRWFGRHMDMAGQLLQKKKSSKGELSLLPVEPYMRLCDSCGTRPAERRFDKDQSGDLLCSSCYKKRDMGIKIRKATSEKGFVWKFKEYIRKNNLSSDWLDAIPPEDLNKLGELDGSGYIGFITADGNHMGKMLQLFEKKEDYSNFSNKLANLMQEIVFDVLARNTRPMEKAGEKILPFEIVLIGGDDLMMFTSVKLAIRLAIEIVERFEKESHAILKETGLLENDFFERLKKGWGGGKLPITPDEPFLKYKKLSMAAGVVLCHSNFPVPALVEIGEALQKSAKKKCAEAEVNYSEGALDFQVITGSAVDLETARAAVPYNRPYSLSEFKNLIGFIEKFHQKDIHFPKTQMQTIYDACHFPNVSRATLATLHTLGRLKRPARKLLKEFFISFSAPDNKYLLWPWTYIAKGSGDQNKTAFVDLVDLFDFVSNKKR